MALCIKSDWVGPDGELALAAIKVMATHWPREKRQDMFDYVASAAFPLGEESELWKYTNRTSETKDGVPFHQLDARIHDKPCIWFRNLRMLQVWEVLGLDCLIQINHRAGKIVLGELVAKIEAISKVIGNDKAKQFKTPALKRKVANRDFPNLRAEGLRERGLRARRTWEGYVTVSFCVADSLYVIILPLN